MNCPKCNKEVEVDYEMDDLVSLTCGHLVSLIKEEKADLAITEPVILEEKPYTQEEVEEGITFLENEIEKEKVSLQVYFNSPVHSDVDLAEEFFPSSSLPINKLISTEEVRELKELKKEIDEENKEVAIQTPKEEEIILILPPIKEVKEEITPFTLTPSPVNHFHNRKTKDIPYPFQEKGIQFAVENKFNVLIADEQGLGKTVQAIGTMYHAWIDDDLRDLFFPVLITAKSNIKTQWMVQLLNWGGMDFIPQIIEDGKIPPIEGFNVYIASYDIFRRFTKTEDVEETSAWGHKVKTSKKKNPFYDFPFKTVIMDEVQAIKGESQRTTEVKRIAKGKNVIALSGTPIKNSAAEYYTVLNLLNPNKFPTKQGYLDRWVRQEIVNGYPKYTGMKHPERFAEFTSDMIIRRTRAEVKDEIGLRVTKANRIFYHVDFESEKLKKAYKAAEAEFIREMEENVRAKNSIEIIGMLSIMRHLVGLNKIQPTVDLAIEFLLENPGGKLVIFVHHTDVMDAIHKLLANWCIDGNYEIPLMYHSGLNQHERYEMIAQFAENKSKKGKDVHIPFLIGSTLAMGEGVDRLQEVCNDCIIAERQWNPANEEQAESRLVRIGQKKEFVNATYPIATGTIDEYFTDIVEVKRRAMKETLDGTVAQWDETGLLTALYDAIVSKGREKKIRKGW